VDPKLSPLVDLDKSGVAETRLVTSAQPGRATSCCS